MKKIRFIATILILISVIASGMTACGNPGSSSDAPVSESSSESEAASEEPDSTDASAPGSDSSTEAADPVSQAIVPDPGNTSSDRVIGDDLVGMEIDMPASYLANEDKVFLNYGGSEIETGLYTLETVLFPAAHSDLEAMDTETYYKALENAMTPMILLRTLDETFTEEEVLSWVETNTGIDPERLEKVASFEDSNGDSWTCHGYFAGTEDIPEALAEELRPIYEEILQELHAAKTGVRLTDAKDPASVNTGNTLSFVTKDVDGNDVKSEDLFADAKYTMVNCWASWCGPCIRELPEIEAMSKEFQERGCQVIGILMDGNTDQGLSDGKDLIAKTGVTYLNVIGNDDIKSQVKLMAYPTTYFVDSNGTIVGEAVIGAFPDSYRSVMDGLLGE